MTALIIFIVISMSAGFIGSRYMPGEWYASLDKPSWNPPGYIFAPVWTVLYILMGVAAWLVWTKGDGAQRITPISIFVLQLALNALWSYLFFGLHRPDLAFIEIIVLWLAILATMILFWRIHGFAGMLLIPYLAWVSFAAVLNFQLWRLNV